MKTFLLRKKTVKKTLCNENSEIIGTRFSQSFYIVDENFSYRKLQAE